VKVISVAIQKGGSGKTTTALNLAAALRDAGKRVLLIDLDPQANLSQSLGILDEREYDVYHLLRHAAFGQAADWGKAIINCHDLDLVPSSLELAGAELELVSIYGREQVLAQLLQKLPQPYDFVFIDCPPSIGMLTVNALVASDFILMPLVAEFLSLKGVKSFCKHLKMVERLNPKIQILGFVLTKFDPRKNMNRNVLEELQQLEDSKGKVFYTHIRSNIALANAQEKGVDIFSYDKNSNGAEDYRALANEFLIKIQPL
jgi:chromosome partitioning protein